LLCGELLRQTERYASEGLHPRILVDGLEIARDATLEFLSTFTVPKLNALRDIDLLSSVARTSLQTKLDADLATILTQAVVSAVTCIADVDDTDASATSTPIDLNRVEIMTMERKLGSDSRFVNGIVLDHGGRHPDMPTTLNNCFIMTCNVTFEYEKTEVASGFFYSTAEEREKLVESERKWLDERCKLVIDFKRSVCQEGEVSIHTNLCFILSCCLRVKLTDSILFSTFALFFSHLS
jgi:T-complex protein 1 subunit zeta